MKREGYAEFGQAVDSSEVDVKGAGVGVSLVCCVHVGGGSFGRSIERFSTSVRVR